MSDETERKRKLRALIRRRQSLLGDETENQIGNRGWGENRRARPKRWRFLQSPEIQKKFIDRIVAKETAEKDEGGFLSPGSLKELGLDNLGSFEDFSTSSTAEEILRYKKKLENRASWLESIFEETLRELEKINEFLEQKLSGASKKTPPKGESPISKAVKTEKKSKGKTAVSKTSPKKSGKTTSAKKKTT